MKKFRYFSLLFFLFIVFLFFNSFFLQGKLPVPSDTIVGLYHPFRDLYAKDYPNGIPYKNFLITDPVRQQYPFRLLSISLLKVGQLPLWNPYNMAGTPLLDTLQSAPFYPLNLLLFIFPFQIGWSLLIALSPLLAGIFLYLYLKNLRLSSSASFLGAFTFAFCGFSTSWLEWGTILHTALWLPLLLLSIDKIFSSAKNNSNSKIQSSKLQSKNKKSLIWTLVFVLSFSTSLLAGHLQTFFYLFIVTEVYFLLRWIQAGKSKNILLLFASANLIFVGLSFPQWFPTLRYILASARGIDQNWQKDGWFIPWQNLLQFISPDFFGNPATLNYWGVWNYAEFVGYVGVLPLLMALLSIFSRRDKKTYFFSGIFILSLIFSLPTILARLPFILRIPLISTSQPTRLLFLTDFSLAVMAALGLDYLIKKSSRKLIAYPIVIIGVAYLFVWTFVLGKLSFIFSVTNENLSIAKHNLYFPTLIFVVLSTFLLIQSFLKNKKRQFILIAILAITILDLLRFSSKFTPFTDQKFLFPTTPSISFLQKQKGPFRIMVTDDRILPPNFSVIYHLQTLDGYDPLYLLRYGEFISAMERGRPDISPPFGFNRIITPRNVSSKFADFLGVRYILSLKEERDPKFKKIFTEGQTKIYQNKNAFPRVFFVRDIKFAKDKQDAINTLFKEENSLNDIAIVEGWRGNEKSFTKGSANIVEYNENSVVISTQSAKDGFLVLTDTFYPTWHAEICSTDNKDCKDAKIYLTDYNFRGVIVPPGNHIIQFGDSFL